MFILFFTCKYLSRLMLTITDIYLQELKDRNKREKNLILKPYVNGLLYPHI